MPGRGAGCTTDQVRGRERHSVLWGASQTSSRYWRLPTASCSKLEGPCCWPAIQVPVGPAVAARTDPEFTQSHYASKAPSWKVWEAWKVWDWVCTAPHTGHPHDTYPPHLLFFPAVSSTSPSTPANFTVLKIIKQSVQFYSYKDVSLPFQSNSKTLYLRAPVLPFPSLLIIVPVCLPGFMLSLFCTAQDRKYTLLFDPVAPFGDLARKKALP